MIRFDNATPITDLLREETSLRRELKQSPAEAREQEIRARFREILRELRAMKYTD